MSTTATAPKTIVVGTCVHSILYGGRNGIVFAIHGEQRPGTVQSMFGGAMVKGGSAYFDIVFDDGTISRRVPEAILHGVQWRIFDEVAGDNRIAVALADAERTKAADEAAKATAKAAFDAEVERLKTDPELAHLKQGNDLYCGKLAAANIRAEVKRVFPKVKFSVRVPHHGSISVKWTDGPTIAEVDALVGKYNGGHFDGMQDLHTFEKTPWITLFGGTNYLHTSRDQSPALIDRAIAQVFTEYAGNLAGMQRPAAAEFEAGRLYSVPVPLMGDCLQSLIWKALATLRG